MRNIFYLIPILFFITGQSQTIKEKRECIYRAAKSQLGVLEKPIGSNGGKEVESYLAGVGLPKGYAWCAAFTTWCYKQCPPLPKYFPVSAWAPAYALPNKIIYSRGTNVKRNGIFREPQRSDLYFVYDVYARRIGHIGLIEDWNPATYGKDYIVTIEGNTNDNGSYEGIGVYRKIRSKRMVYAVATWFE